MLATPEARLVLACLRRLADPDDTLATAEVIALQATVPPEEWISQRLDYVAQHSEGTDRWAVEEPHAHPAVKALEASRSSLIALSPQEALDLALNAAGVFATVSSWGPNVSRVAQRRANLESLRALAQKYEAVCATNHQPATIAGYLFWCDDLAEDKADTKGSDDQINAVHVSTYHNGIIVTADPSGIANGIELLLNDHELSKTIATNGLFEARLNDWKARASNILDFLRDAGVVHR